MCRTAQTPALRSATIHLRSTAAWIVTGLSVLAATVFGIVRRRRRAGGPSDLGWVTEQWLVEHRADQVRRRTLTTDVLGGHPMIPMIRARALPLSVFGVLLSAQLVHAQDISRYREVEMRSSLLAVAGLSGLTPADAKVIHQRPAIIQDLEWRLRSSARGSTVQDDPVRDIVFSFYNDQLFRIVVKYDRDRTIGLTDTDLIEALSIVYGAPAVRIVARPRASETSDDIDEDTVVARWENAESSVTVLRSAYPTPVRLVLLSKQLAGLARTATAAAVRLDVKEAPQREVERAQKEEDAARAAQGKARPANKAAFKP
jgi:hypothetical protein